MYPLIFKHHDGVVKAIFNIIKYNKMKVKYYGIERRFSKADRDNLRSSWNSEASLYIRKRPDLIITHPQRYLIEIKTTQNIDCMGLIQNLKREIETIYVVWNGSRKTIPRAFFVHQLNQDMYVKHKSYITVKEWMLYDFRKLLYEITRLTLMNQK